MSYRIRTYIAVAVDPIHVGAGGYRLGRVDNTIIREPGTNLPKIPGTSFSGVVRSYAAIRLNDGRCAGTTGCGGDICPICYTFGSTPMEGEPETRKSYQGTVRFSDGQVVLFPVHSMLGPVWLITAGLLKETFGIEGAAPPDDETLRTTLDTTGVGNRLNLSWLLLRTGERLSLSSQNPLWTGLSEDIRGRLAVASPKLFSQVVNTNLEVRTSVAINPATGAAEEKKLFTYEALPRTTVVAFEVVEYDYRQAFPSQANVATPLHVVDQGLGYLGFLGIGGMGTRGFGRLEVRAYNERRE
ncbi:MAG: type III-B CRISPR module RAMP protein Cmr4 [Syntrophaceae bacterium]|nr:type III-B CRISPR module RAMP protein Cmr4 [Syntrophaceae bacterium]